MGMWSYLCRFLPTSSRIVVPVCCGDWMRKVCPVTSWGNAFSYGILFQCDNCKRIEAAGVS